MVDLYKFTKDVRSVNLTGLLVESAPQTFRPLNVIANEFNGLFIYTAVPKRLLFQLLEFWCVTSHRSG